MNKEFDLIVYIGRFQPFHNGHMEVVKEALQRGRRLLILVGSANSARTVRNPFTYEERRDMIAETILSEFPNLSTFNIFPLNDHLYQEHKWIKEARSKILSVLVQSDENQKVALIGHKKDSTSYYLDFFPEMERIETEIDFSNQVSGTEIRDSIYVCLHDGLAYEDLAVSPPTLETIKAVNLQGPIEDDYHRYCTKVAWKNSPYPPIFQTVDAIVTCLGYVLTIVRKEKPGRGLRALPGGHVDPGETLLNACIRELYEETTLQFPIQELKKCLRNWVGIPFDDPNRSSVGRVITHGFHFDLSRCNGHPVWELPGIMARDDAEDVSWRPITSLDPRQFHDDHYHIIQYFLKGQ